MVGLIIQIEYTSNLFVANFFWSRDQFTPHCEEYLEADIGSSCKRPIFMQQLQNRRRKLLDLCRKIQDHRSMNKVASFQMRTTFIICFGLKPSHCFEMAPNSRWIEPITASSDRNILKFILLTISSTSD